jgi:hypothetical protein
MYLNTKKVLLIAFRTALLAIIGFTIYEMLVELEKIWNIHSPNNHKYHFHKRRILHFLAIFLIDLLLIYMIFFVFNVEL